MMGDMAQQSDDVIERLLDLALEATFPASDPVSISSAVAAVASDPRTQPLVYEALR
jgi:hypothetical protein